MTMSSQFHRKNPRVHFWTLITALLCAVACYAQTQPNSATTLAEEISQVHQTIQQAEQQHLADDRIGYMWAVLAAKYRRSGDFSASEDAYFRALKLLDHSPTAARNYGTTLDNLAMLYLTYGRLEEAELYNRQGAKIRDGLGLPLDEARSEEHRAEIDLARHRFKATEDEAAHALEVMMRLGDPEKLDIVSALNALAFARCSRKACTQGMEDAQHALSLARSFFGEQSGAVSHALMAIGFAEWKLGQLDEADRTMRSSIQMMKTQEGVESRGVMLAMLEYRNYLQGVHRDGEAEEIMQEISLSMHQQTPVCATCVNVHTLSNAMR